MAKDNRDDSVNSKGDRIDEKETSLRSTDQAETDSSKHPSAATGGETDPTLTAASSDTTDREKARSTQGFLPIHVALASPARLHWKQEKALTKQKKAHHNDEDEAEAIASCPTENQSVDANENRTPSRKGLHQSQADLKAKRGVFDTDSPRSVVATSRTWFHPLPHFRGLHRTAGELEAKRSKRNASVREPLDGEDIAIVGGSNEMSGQLQQQQQQQQPQTGAEAAIFDALYRPGAYAGAREDDTDLERVNTIPFSLVGAAAPDTPTDPPEDMERIAAPNRDHYRHHRQQPDQSSSSDVDVELANTNTAPNSFGLVVANPVEESFRQVLGEAVAVDPEEQHMRQIQRSKRQIGVFVGMTLLVLLLVAIILAVVLTRDPFSDTTVVIGNEHGGPVSLSTNSPSTAAPSLTPSQAPTSLIVDLPNYTLDSLNDPSSPQSRTYNWLLEHLEHQDTDIMPEWRKKQLFGLVTFYFSFLGEHWPEGYSKDWLDHDRSECLWWSVAFSVYDEATGKYSEACVPGDQGTPFDCDELVPCRNGTNEFRQLTIGGLAMLKETSDPNLLPTIPPEISLISNLELLSISLNTFNATLPDLLPTQLQELPNLKRIDISYNRNIRGQIPCKHHSIVDRQSLLLFPSALLTSTYSIVSPVHSHPGNLDTINCIKYGIQWFGRQNPL